MTTLITAAKETKWSPVWSVTIRVIIKSNYQLIIKITISEKRNIAKL